jgi:hypothetical protein
VDPPTEATDYAIVAPLMDSKTGQFTVAVAGIMGAGTQVAADFVSNPAYLEEGLRDAPADWRTRNPEIVLQTAITDSAAGPPPGRGRVLLVDSPSSI